MIYGPDVIDTRLSLSFNYDLFYLTAAYGITDNIDVSIALTIHRAALSAFAAAPFACALPHLRVRRYRRHHTHLF